MSEDARAVSFASRPVAKQPTRTVAPANSASAIQVRRRLPIEFPKDMVRWTGEGGEPSLYRSSNYSSRAFYVRCGSTLGAIDDAPTVALVFGCFDDKTANVLNPVSHSFEDNCPSWARIAGMTVPEEA